MDSDRKSHRAGSAVTRVKDCDILKSNSVLGEALSRLVRSKNMLLSILRAKTPWENHPPGGWVSVVCFKF